MQNANEITLRLVIVDDSAEHAEALVSALRNSGIAVRPHRPTNSSELAAILDSQTVDLVMAAEQQSLDWTLVSQQAGASGKDIPVILLVQERDETRLVEAMSGGIRAVALRKRPEHVLAVARNEFTDLQARRGLCRL